LPKLLQRSNPRNGGAQPSAPHRITVAERNAIYEHAARKDLGGGRAHPALFRQRSAPGCGRRLAVTDVLRIAARLLRNPALRRAADAYDRVARAPYGRIPRCTYAGDGLAAAPCAPACCPWLNGRRGRQRSAGTYPSKRQADRAWQRAEVRLELGRAGDPAKSRQTFRQYVEETWLPNHEAEATIRAGYTGGQQLFAQLLNPIDDNRTS
jgi:hypothetical protein